MIKLSNLKMFPNSNPINNAIPDDFSIYHKISVT